MTRLNELIEAARSNQLHTRVPPLTKADFLEGEMPPLRAREVIDKIDDVIELLAKRNEFLTVNEWCEQKYGSHGKLSLADIASTRASHLLTKHGYICNALTIGKVPSPPLREPMKRSPSLVPARQQENKAFWDACAEGDVKRAQAIWEGINVNLEYSIVDHDGIHVRTPLMAAAARGHKKAVEFLLDAGAKPDAERSGAFSPLLVAIQNQHSEVALVLIDALCTRYKDNPAKLQEALTQSPRDMSVPSILAGRRCKYVVRWSINNAIRQANGVISGIAAPNVEYRQEQSLPLKDKLAAFGGSVTRAQLLKQPEDGQSLLGEAILGNALGEVLSMMRRSCEHLSGDDWRQIDQRTGISYLQTVLKHPGQLPVLFAPEQWVGHVREMQDLWKEVPPSCQALMDGNDGRPSFRRNLQQANAASARSLGGGAGIGM